MITCAVSGCVNIYSHNTSFHSEFVCLYQKEVAKKEWHVHCLQNVQKKKKTNHTIKSNSN